MNNIQACAREIVNRELIYQQQNENNFQIILTKWNYMIK